MIRRMIGIGVMLSALFALSGIRIQAAVPLGAGLNGEIDWSRDEAFVDMVKTTRGFYPSGGAKDPVKTDSNGWPLADFWMRVSDTGAPVGAGIYHLSFTGPPETTVDCGVSGAALVKTGYDKQTGRTTYAVTVGPATTVLEFNFHRTLGQVKKIQVIRPGYDPLHPPLFTRAYLALIQARSPAVLRFMDWHATNGNLEAHWSERSQPTDATQTSTLTKLVSVGWSPTPVSFTNARGICWEYCTALANAVNKDIWINVPLLADDDYVTHLATLIQKTLNPHLKIYVEYSNEVWNDGFLQSGQNRDAAVAEVNAGHSPLNYDGTPVTDAVTLGDRRVAKRLWEIQGLFAHVFGPTQLQSRIRPILAYQLSPYRFDNQLTFLNAVYGKPSRYFYGIAIAPYFACGNGQGADARTDLTKDDVLKALNAAVAQYEDTHVIDDCQTLATYYGLKLCAYEGGPDTFGPHNIQAKKAATLDPRMKAIIVKYLTLWYAKGGDQFNWFTLGAGNYDAPYGTWSLTDNLRDRTQPKELAFDAVRTGLRPPFTAGFAVPGERDARFYAEASDPENGPYVRYIGAGSHYDYLLRVPQAGRYQLRVSVGNAKPNAQLEVWLNDVLVKSVVVSVNGAQDESDTFADTAPISLTLPAGFSVIRLRVPGERPYDLNSLKITRADEAKPRAALPMLGGFQFYWQQTVSPGTAFSQSFTVNDAQTSPAALRVTAHSDTQALVPDTAIVLTRDPKNPRVFNFTVTPMPHQTGRARITFTVTNRAGLSRSAFFQLTVPAPGIK